MIPVTDKLPQLLFRPDLNFNLNIFSLCSSSAEVPPLLNISSSSEIYRQEIHRHNIQTYHMNTDSASIQWCKLKYFSHVVRAENLSTDMLHGASMIADLEAGQKDAGWMMWETVQVYLFRSVSGWFGTEQQNSMEILCVVITGLQSSVMRNNQRTEMKRNTGTECHCLSYTCSGHSHLLQSDWVQN